MALPLFKETINREWRKIRAHTLWTRPAFVVTLFVVVIAGLCIGIAALVDYTFGSAAASVGDTFGVPNAIFTSLAFVGVIVAFYYQRKELQMQREELQLQRMELKLTRREMKHQRQEMSKSAEAQTKSGQALSRQAELLLLASYLNAQGGLQQSYENEAQRGGSNTSLDKLAQIRGVLEVISERLRPQIEVLAQHTGADGNTRSLNYFKYVRLYERLGEAGKRFIQQWRARFDPSRKGAAKDVEDILLALRLDLEQLAGALPEECDGLMTNILSQIQDALGTLSLHPGQLFEEKRIEGETVYSLVPVVADMVLEASKRE